MVSGRGEILGHMVWWEIPHCAGNCVPWWLDEMSYQQAAGFCPFRGARENSLSSQPASQLIRVHFDLYHRCQTLDCVKCEIAHLHISNVCHVHVCCVCLIFLHSCVDSSVHINVICVTASCPFLPDLFFFLPILVISFQLIY